VDFAEERERKSFCLVRCEKNNTTYETIPTPCRDFITIDVNVPDSADDPTDVMVSEIEAYPIADAVVRVIYSISAEKAPQLNLRRVQESLRPAHAVAYVMPRTSEPRRTTRVALSETMSWQEAFDLYIKQHEELQPYAEELKVSAQRLEQEIER
jgi:exonuclease SbcD